ncbi:hypothetical protein C0J56_27240 [Pseudomonas fluorescens]|nr:hypothetical protein C0J56_27240 [Pseudomonas fluorescens]
MWERACSRRRLCIRHIWRLIHRLREQARSHRGYASAYLFATRPIPAFAQHLQLAASNPPPSLPNPAIPVGQSLPRLFHPAEAILSCAPICAGSRLH